MYTLACDMLIIILCARYICHIVQLYKFVKLTGLFYAGSHGMDIIGPVKKDNIEDGHPNHTITTDKLVRDIPFLHIQILKPFVVNFFCTLYLLFDDQTSFCHFAT